MTAKLRHFFYHYFFPHHSNNYKAKTLHASHLVFYLLFLILVQSSSSIFKMVQPNVLGYATNITVEKVFYLINAQRQKNGLPPLNLSKELSDAATRKASDMFLKNYWAHVSPTGTTPWEFITSSGYNYIYAGENLAKNFETTEDVVNAWMNSPTHRANILKSEYKEIGLAVMNGVLQGDETTLVVQEFGSRKNVFVGQEKTSGKTDDLQLADNSQDKLLASQENGQKPVFNKINLYNPLKLSKNVSLFIAEFLLVILLIDGIYMWRQSTIRVSGHSLAHIIFMATLLGAMGATGIGAIL